MWERACSSSGGGRRSVATTKNTRQEASKVRGQSAQSVTQKATISWGRRRGSSIFTTKKSRHDISEVRSDTVESTTEVVKKTAITGSRVCYEIEQILSFEKEETDEH